MRGANDLGKAKPPVMEAKPPAEETRPPDPGVPKVTEGAAQGGQNEQGTSLSQDSIVQATPQSQDDEEDEDMMKSAAAESRDTNKQQRADLTNTDGESSTNKAAPVQNESDGGRGVNATPESAEASARPEQEETTRIVEPFEMFEAVVAEMKEAPEGSPHAAWTLTIAELYGVAHDKVSIDEDLIPASKKHYPKLKGEEKGLLYKLFKEVCVTANGTYEEWERYAQAATQDLYNTSWSFKTIMNRMISKVQYAKTKPLNQWATKVKMGTSVSGARASNSERNEGYQDFMFNPALFSRTDIIELKAICEQPPAAATGTRLRAGTKEEWRIIAGIAEGSIVCRRPPEFMKSVLDSKERIRLYSTIQRQVEGELQLQLRGRTTVKPNRQFTQTIQEDIRLAAEELHVNTPELRKMLALAKTISYNHAQRSLHFFFFDRATAQQFQSTPVPFRKVIYRLSNVHSPDTGSVWKRQLGRDGTRMVAQRQYAIDIHNVTRFTDVGRLTAYLQEHIAAAFDMEDMDTCTPESRTSTVWRLTMKTAECPDFLRGIVRIIWFGRTLVLMHPSMRQRLQCLRCGNLGHIMARCRYTDALLLGSGSRVANEQEVSKLEDLAKPFASMAEVRASAAKRLSLQEEAERQAQAALAPQPEGGPRPQSGEKADDKAPGESATTRPAAETKDLPVQPEPKRQWATVPLHNRRTLYAHPAALRQKFQVDRSQFAVLDEAEDSSEAQEAKSEDNPTPKEIIEVLSDSDQEDKAPTPLTSAERAKLHLVQAKPPNLRPPPQLVGLKQRERKKLAEAVGTPGTRRGRLVPLENYNGEELSDFTAIENSLGLRQVSTPSTGNCMAMALAQALADEDLVETNGRLEAITASLKRGIRWTGQLHMLEQFTHYVRKTTLINVQRGWDGMEAHESIKQFKWYLEDYASSTSARDAIIPRYNWGCSEMLAVAANFLQRQIFVMAYDIDHKQQWHCSVYRPSTTTRGRQTFEIGQQHPLLLGRCIALIRVAKIKDKQPPLVLRYWGEHYSAFIHQRAQTQTPPASAIQTREPPATAAEGASQEKTPPSQGREASQDPWDGALWNGDVEDLRRRLIGMTIPHELQCEISLILEQAEPNRYAELLAFLVNTAAQLSEPQRTALLHLNLAEEPTAEVRELLQTYQLPLSVLQQWQEETARVRQEELEMQTSQQSRQEVDSDSSYDPSSTSSSQTSQIVTRGERHQTRSQSAASKRPHTLTPIEGERIRLAMKAKLEHQTSARAPGQTEHSEDWDMQVDQQGSRETWPDLWTELANLWPSRVAVAFPLMTSKAEEWCATAQQEPYNLIYMCQRFQYPEEVLATLGDKVLEVWTAGWRKECLYGSLVEYRSKTEDPSTCRWLDEWKAKLLRPAPPNLAPLIDNREDWVRLRKRSYGEDDVLRLCDIGHKDQLARHLLCAFLYEKEIRVLTGREDEADTGPLTRLTRHLRALETVKAYGQAYAGSSRVVNWHAVARFFSVALERGATERDRHT